MRAVVLHNPAAGSGKVSADDLLAALAAGGTAGRYCSTKESRSSDALKEPTDLIVAAGGDGTVLKALHYLRDRRTPIAILPLGGSNNTARSLGITADPLEIAQAGWRETDARRLDIGVAAGPWGRRLFLEAIGVGVLAEAAAVVEEQGASGPGKSELAREALLDMLAGAQPEGIRFTVDGQEVKCRCLLAEIMNTSTTGPRLSLAPAADPGDGLLDLVWLEPEARTEMLTWLEGSMAMPPPLTTRRGREFAFEWRQGRLHVGDAFFGPPERPCTVQVMLLPDPATVLVPAGVEPLP